MHRVCRNVLPKSVLGELAAAAKGLLSGSAPKDLQKESVSARVLSFQFLTEMRYEAIRRYLDPKREYLLCPLFYLRFVFPGTFISEKHKNAFLYTEPHYDTAYGINGRSYWIPFQETSEATGSICTFAEEVQGKFPPPAPHENNYFNISRYLEEAPQVDALLRREMKPIYLSAGDILEFDRTFLHGATKPKSQSRLSLNLRLLSESDLRQASRTDQNLIRRFNAGIDEFNARNIQTLTALDKDVEKVSWRDEYAWFRSGETNTLK